ncbi:capsule assembly Wzi family protein, partial [Reichenbachiella sp.]|uniref:capsule assembly Wzi family protein n=2 Tax=Reichenbachiella sp. TaxID=2184521 RepID=UPI00329988EF
ISGKYGNLEYTIAPMVYFSQNDNFQLSPDRDENFPYRYAYNSNIDYVQRYGEDSFVKFDWGQMDIRAVFNWFTIGASTQNMVWGPAQVTPIIMGNQSAGIPHVDLGTHRPVETKIGNFEMKVFWGLLKESDFFDEDSDNNNRYWTGASLGYSPSFINGLYLGVNRAFYKRGNEFSAKDLFVSVWTFKSVDEEDKNPNTGNDEFDQMGSLMIRWSFEEVGFESYFELAKNDFGGGFTGLEPEHARAYTLGFIKLIDLSNDKLIKLTYEHTSLDRAKTSLYRNHNEWFTHNYVKQGYTHDGQLISGGIGPSSNTDHFGFQYYSSKGKFSATAQRIRFDDDYFFSNINVKELHDMEWAGELNYTRIYDNNRFNLHFGIAYRQNIYYILDENIVNLSAGISWTHLF